MSIRGPVYRIAGRRPIRAFLEEEAPHAIPRQSSRGVQRCKKTPQSYLVGLSNDRVFDADSREIGSRKFSFVRPT